MDQQNDTQKKLEATQAELAEVDTALAAARQERADLEARKPEIAARALKDKGAAKELNEVNARLAALPDLIAGLDFQLSQLKDQAVALEAQLDSAKRATLRGDYDSTLGKLNQRVQESITAINQAQTALEDATKEYETLARVSQMLGDAPLPSWVGTVFPVVKAIKALAGHGRYRLDLR